MFCDLKKAFDTLNHEVLLKKIDRLGFLGIFHNLLKDYLTNRIQLVQNGKNRLSELNLTCGVPRGSVLGPLLFLLYINCLTEVIRESEIVLFADETIIYISGPLNSNQKLSDDIERANEWFSENALTVNNSKCYTMIFGKNRIAHYNALGGSSSQKLVGKYLGIIIDNKLSFTDHIKRICTKLATFCGIIYKARNLFSKKQLLCFYNSYAISVIQYGIVIYGSTTKNHLNEIFKLQKRILRAIFFKRKFDSISEKLIEVQIETVFDLYLKFLFKELFCQIRKVSPLDLLNIEKIDNRSHLRSKSRGILPSVTWHCRVMKFSLSRSLVLAYNYAKENHIYAMDDSTFKTFFANFFRIYVFDNKDLHDLIFN